MQYDQELEGPVTPNLDGELNRCVQLADCEAFGVELHDLAGRLELDTEGVPNVYVVVAGKGLLGIGRAERAIKSGDVWLTPACVGPHSLELDGEELRVLRVTAPE